MTTLVFTRPEERLPSSIELAEKMGFKVLAAPSLRIIEGDEGDMRRFEQGMVEGTYAAVVITSVTAVEHSIAKVRDERIVSRMHDVVLIAIGRATRDSLRDLGFDPSMPDEYTSTGLVDMFSDTLKGKRVCLLRSDKGSRILNDGLIQAGADIDEIHVYKLEPVMESAGMDIILDEMIEGTIDAYAFTSALSAKTFLDIAEHRIGRDLVVDRFKEAVVAAIGAPTAEEIERLGHTVDIVSTKADFPMMLQEIREFLDSISV